MEPFHIKDEIRNGVLNRDGTYKMKRERDEEVDLIQDDEQYEEDAWFQSVKN